MAIVLRLCLDLNIWCAALLADRKGRQGTASQCLVEMARYGSCSISPVQLVISWGMLERLRLVLERDLHVSSSAVNFYIETIRAYAELGAIKLAPQLTLGGTGVIALQDTEDRHVIETALAGRALVLVTANFKDFLSKDTLVVVPQQHAVYSSPNHILHIVHPFCMMGWLRIGQIPDFN